MLVEALDRENLIEYFLQAGIGARFRHHILLQKITVGIDLEADQIGNRQHFFKLAKIDPFCHSSLTLGKKVTMIYAKIVFKPAATTRIGPTNFSVCRMIRDRLKILAK
ncbi:hypothetical protein SDC9_89864 [bioreactor metagenome]|uniref:Uncharacterized protein n=1 Tax=bioreactor metagenome TaxID=1076179 RepID=A0A644ZTH2_9ZZZZ